MTMKGPDPYEDEVSGRQFLKFTLIYKKFNFEKYYLLILIPKLKGLKLK